MERVKAGPNHRKQSQFCPFLTALTHVIFGPALQIAGDLNAIANATGLVDLFAAALLILAEWVARNVVAAAEPHDVGRTSTLEQ